MKILLVNKYHYVKGGSETYYFGLADLLTKLGHEVIYFSMADITTNHVNRKNTLFQMLILILIFPRFRR